MKIWILDWKNGMIGGFYDNTLEQCFNTDKELLAWSIRHVMEMHECESVEIGFIDSHEELNQMRQKRGFDTKSTFVF